MFVARVKVLIPANQMPSICMVVDDIPFYVKFKLLKTETETIVGPSLLELFFQVLGDLFPHNKTTTTFTEVDRPKKWHNW